MCQKTIAFLISDRHKLSLSSTLSLFLMHTTVCTSAGKEAIRICILAPVTWAVLFSLIWGTSIPAMGLLCSQGPGRLFHLPAPCLPHLTPHPQVLPRGPFHGTSVPMLQRSALLISVPATTLGNHMGMNFLNVEEGRNGCVVTQSLYLHRIHFNH